MESIKPCFLFIFTKPFFFFRIYLIGGRGSGNERLNEIVVLDENLNSERIELSPINERMCGCALGETLLFGFGRKENGNFSNEIIIYHLQNNSFTPYNFQVARSSASSVNTLNKCYLIGGIDELSNPLTNFEIFDKVESRWKEGPPLKIAKSMPSSISINFQNESYILVFGGKKDEKNYLRKIKKMEN